MVTLERWWHFGDCTNLIIDKSRQEEYFLTRPISSSMFHQVWLENRSTKCECLTHTPCMHPCSYRYSNLTVDTSNVNHREFHLRICIIRLWGVTYAQIFRKSLQGLMETTLQKSNRTNESSPNWCHNLIDCIENKPMLGRYISECMVSVININNEIKEPTHGYKNCDTSQTLTFGGNVKARKSFYTQVNIWVRTIPNHIDARTVLRRYEGSCMEYRPECYREQNHCQTQIPYLYREMWIPHCKNLSGIFFKWYNVNTGINYLQCQSAWAKVLAEQSGHILDSAAAWFSQGPPS